MPATILNTLTDSQHAQILSANPAFPIQDADLFALYEEAGTIRSAAAFIKEGHDLFECYAYTLPQFRQQGYFSELLDLVIDELTDDVEFLFYTDGKENDTRKTLDALECELVTEEHMMEIALNALHTGALKSPERLPFPDRKEVILDETTTLQYSNLYGTVSISVFSSYYYLYDFEIREEFRGQGHGTTFLNQVLADLAAMNPLPLRLQVSGSNLPAVSLYKKTGFQIIETLSGYLY